MRNPKVYSWAVVEAIEAQLPQSIIDAMNRHGWDALGIYELVARELRKEQQRNKVHTTGNNIT